MRPGTRRRFRPEDLPDQAEWIGDPIRQDDPRRGTRRFKSSRPDHLRIFRPPLAAPWPGLTYIPHQDWANGPTLRIQKRAHDGRVVRGPEFPAAKAEDLVRAIHDVMRE
jgi:hypothetical protein